MSTHSWEVIQLAAASPLRLGSHDTARQEALVLALLIATYQRSWCWLFEWFGVFLIPPSTSPVGFSDPKYSAKGCWCLPAEQYSLGFWLEIVRSKYVKEAIGVSASCFSDSGTWYLTAETKVHECRTPVGLPGLKAKSLPQVTHSKSI